MAFSFSIIITNDSGEEMTYEEYAEERMEKIESIISRLETLKDDLENLISEEVDFRDNLPEESSITELSELSQELSDNLEDAFSSLEECVSSLSDIL